MQSSEKQSRDLGRSGCIIINWRGRMEGDMNKYAIGTSWHMVLTESSRERFVFSFIIYRRDTLGLLYVL
jgi:hypothetical protein